MQDHVLDVALKYVEKKYGNYHVRSEMEFTFFAPIPLDDEKFVGRIWFDDMRATLKIAIAAPCVAVPEHDGLEEMMKEIGRRSNPDYGGVFRPIFLPGFQQGVVSEYEASMPWCPLAKPVGIGRFIADALKRGGYGVLAFRCLQSMQVDYPSVVGLRAALLDMPPGYLIN